MRKTVKVQDIKQTINDMLFHSGDHLTDARSMVMAFLETLLMSTGNYKGFRYLSKQEMLSSNAGTTYGINEDLTFDGTDSTRVQYH